MSNKPTIQPPPEGWRTAVSSKDEKIGYILRNMSEYSLDYEMVHHVLRLSKQYDEERQKGARFYG